MGDFILNFITLGIGKIIEKIAPSVVKLFKKVFNQMDDIAKISEKLGEKVSKAITSIDGEAALKEADEVIDALKGSGATDDIIESIAEKSGLKGLKTYEELLKSGLSEDAIEKAIKNGFDLNEVKALYEKGIKPDQYLEYGIKNSTEASWVNKYLSEGYDINDIKKLSEKGINPSSYESRGINSAEDAAKEALNGASNHKVQELIGHDFEEYLTKTIGGEGSFSKGGRDFDGGVGNRWWEAKSGGYWDLIMNNPKKLELFKSSMGDRLRIAKNNGATYELITNSPIPQEIKDWLTKKGIPYTEILD